MQDWEKYQKLQDRKADYDGKLNWFQTRKRPSEYQQIEDYMWKHGVGKLWLRPVTNHDSPDFLSIEVDMPENWWYLLTNEEGDRKKRRSSRYHFTLAEPWVLEQMKPEHKEDFRNAVLDFYNAHFPPRNDTEWKRFTDDETDEKNYRRWLSYDHDWKEFEFNKDITLGSGATIQFGDMSDPFVRRGYELQRIGTKKNAFHISLD
jgi:hypothetical protein